MTHASFGNASAFGATPRLAKRGMMDDMCQSLRVVASLALAGFTKSMPFAFPYCASSEVATRLAHKMFSHTGVCNEGPGEDAEEGPPGAAADVNYAAGFSPTAVKARVLEYTTQGEKVAHLVALLEEVKLSNGFLILVFHEVLPGNDTSFDDRWKDSEGSLRAQLEAVRASGVRVVDSSPCPTGSWLPSAPPWPGWPSASRAFWRDTRW